MVTQLLYVAAELGVARVLADGPLTGAEVAERVGADPAALTRVLRGLALEDVVDEAGGRFALTPIGEQLEPLAGAARVRGRLYHHAAEGLLDAVRTGGTAFERVHEASFFAHLDTHPDDDAAFQASMAGRSEAEAGAVVAAYDFGAFSSLVDVGGGRGILLRAILDGTPLRATLVDRPARSLPRASGWASARRASKATSSARSRPAPTPTCSREYCTTGTTSPPAGSSRSSAGRSRPAGRLLVVDAILPERAKDLPGAIRMDLHMLVLLRGPRADGGRVPRPAGLRRPRGTALVPTGSPAGLSVIEAATAP